METVGEIAFFICSERFFGNDFRCFKEAEVFRGISGRVAKRTRTTSVALFRPSGQIHGKTRVKRSVLGVSLRNAKHSCFTIRIERLGSDVLVNESFTIRLFIVTQRVVMSNANFSRKHSLRGFVCLCAMLGGLSSIGFAQQDGSQEQVISFDAANGSNPKGNEPAISFQLQNAPWEFVLREFGRKAGYTLQMLDIPPGTLTYSDRKTYTPDEALDILHGYLLQEGYVMVKRDRFLVVLNVDKRPIPPNLIPNVPAEDLEKRGSNELVNVVLPLQNAEAEDVSKEVEALLGPQGKVVPLPTSNAIVVTDTSATLVRVRRLVENIAAGEEDLKFKSFPLKHINAEDAAYLVQSQLGIGTGVTNVSAAQEYSRDPRYRGGPPSSSSRSSQTATPGTQVTPDLRTNSLLVTATTETLGLVEEMISSIDVGENADGQILSAGRGKPYLKVYSLESADAREVAKTLDAVRPGVVINEDGRARRLHIKATESEHKEIEEIIRQLDGGAGGTQQVAVIPLADLDPLGAAATLRSLFASDGDAAPIIEADTYGMRLMVRGTFDQVTQVKTLLAQLGEDGTGQSTGTARGGTVRNIPLGGRNAQRFVDLLEREWSRSKTSPVRIVVPSRSSPVGDRLVPGQSTMRSNENSLDDIQSRRRESAPSRPRPERDDLLPVNFEGEPAAAEAKSTKAPTGPATVVVYADGMLAFNGKTVSAIDELKELLINWKSQSGNANVQVTVDPKAPAPALSAVFATAQEAGSEINLRSEKTTPPKPETNTTDTASISSENPPAKNADESPKPETAGNPKDDVTIIVRDDQLVLLSDNEDALDQMEELIGDLAQAVPPEITWTVFYLRVADATTTAAMLEQLFPSSSVGTAAIPGEESLMGSLTGGLSTLGGGLMDMAGLSGLSGVSQTLRIIPDLRSNSLFVTGPAGQVRDVEQMLKILDSDEVPESLRERLPRMIPVDHASVTEVAEILKEVYKDYLEDPNARAAQNNRGNPLAMMMGGGGRGSSSTGPGIRMTIGVDARTSTLVVSANDTLFRQVEALVEELDNSAFEAHETIRVVPVGEADAAIVQAALTSLIPSVKVSTTNAKPSTTASSSSNNSSSGDTSRDDNVRQFFEQRMRERAAEQSRGGSSSGGRPSFFGGGGGDRGGRDRGGSSRRSGFGGGSFGGGSSRRGR